MQVRYSINSFVAFLMFMMQGAFAAPADGCSNVACTGDIQDIYIESVDTIFITPPEGTYTGLSCALNSGLYFKLPMTHARFKEIYALVLTAHAAQKKIQLRVTADAVGECTIKYVVMYR